MYPKHMMRQTVTLYSGGTPDDTGGTTGDTGTDHKARVEFVNKTQKSDGGQSAEGDTAIIAMKVWIAGTVTVGDHARIDYDGQQYRVEGKTGIPDGTGKVRMLMLECSEWQG